MRTGPAVIQQDEGTHNVGVKAGPTAPSTVRTVTGRRIPPPPHSCAGVAHLAADSYVHQTTWMLEQAKVEAAYRGDAAALARFKIYARQPFASAQAGECCLYLFGRVYPVFDAASGNPV